MICHSCSLQVSAVGTPDEVFDRVCDILNDLEKTKMAEQLKNANIVFVLGEHSLFQFLHLKCL